MESSRKLPEARGRGLPARDRSFLRVIPLPSKAATKKLAEEVVRFSMELGYGKEDEVTFTMDTEKATTSLLEMVVEVRVRMGLKAAKQFGKPYDKGRTAKVERYIQTVRSQAMTLIASVEDAIGRILPMEHVLRAWALQHSAWLLNRFHWHSSIAASPFATVHGRPYAGKIIPFGEYCYGLKKPTVKGTRSALWTGGIWVGKTSQQDMHLLMVGDGTIICKSVRRSREPWKPNMVMELSGSPWMAKPRKITKPMESMMPPLPQIPEEAGGVEDLEDEQASDPETDDSPSSMEEQSGEIAQKLEGECGIQPGSSSDAGMVAGGQPRERGDGEESCAKKLKPDDAMLTELLETGDSAGESPTKKLRAMRVGMYPPMFAGVNAVGMRENDDEEFAFDECCENEMEFLEEEDESEQGQPPQVTDEEKQKLDVEAAQAEVEKLKQLGVVSEIEMQQCDPEGKFIDLKEVWDWRFRDECWKRRCRIVAREFKTTQGDATTFAPTSASSVPRMLFLLHLLFGWKIMVLDVRDAFLTVEQQELCYVEIRPWIRQALGIQEGVVWQLHRCLPGQRNAALRWFLKFTGILKHIGFVECVNMPSLMKHGTRQLVINIHVDDELVAGQEADIRWLKDELGRMCKLQVEGPFPDGARGNGEEISYLKKKYIFTERGIAVQSNSKHTNVLEELYKLHGRKVKMVPEHGELGTPDKTAELEGEAKKRFRSGLGTAMYMAQERADIQFATKSLASHMAKPTKKAEACLQHLILYLMGTRDLGVLMEYVEPGYSLMKKLHMQVQQTSEQLIEVFCDSDWGGNRATRQSTTSVMVFINSILCFSYSRGQKSIALSSCEAEVLAATSAGSEALLIKTLWEFICNRVAILELRSDSSSGRQWLQRSGVGRMKHFQIRLCWIQSAIRNGEFGIFPIGTQLNVADLNTKRRFLRFQAIFETNVLVEI